MFVKRLFLVSLALASGIAFAQTDPDMEVARDQRQTPQQEQQKFHPMPVRGTPAADTAKSYAERLKLEALSPFSSIKWRNIGPETQSGRVLDIAAPLGAPQKLYVAFATGGLYRTEDDGLTWTSLFDGLDAFGIGAIAVSRDGKTLWVGSGEANNQRTSYAGTGIFKSTDEGKTWTKMGLEETHHIAKILIDPRDENTVYACAMGHLYSQNPERGVYKTTDGGKTWKLVLKVDEETGAIDMVLDPKHPNNLVASMYDRDRKAWDYQNSGKGSGVYRSTDGGATWHPVKGLPTGYDAGRIGLGNCASHPDTIYAMADDQGVDPDWAIRDEKVVTGRLTPRRFLLLTEDTIQQVDHRALETFFRQYPPGDLKTDDILAQIKAKKLTLEQIRKMIEDKAPNTFDGGMVHDEVFRSDDGGKTFHPVTTQFLGELGGYYYERVVVNPTDPNDVYVTGLPLLRSTDGGKSWTYVFRRAHVDYHAVWHDPRDPRKVWVGNDGGLYVSWDGGEHMRHIENLAVGQGTAIAVDNKYPYNVYIGMQDNGTMKGPSNFRPGISDPDAWKVVGGGDGAAIAVDPRGNGDVAYISSQFGAFGATDFSKNDGWGVRPALPKGDPPMRFNWVTPIFLSTFDPDIVYLGAQRLYRSFDMGRHFEPISPDLTKNLPDGNVPYSTIKDISESPLRFGLIYVGCDDGNVKMTPDGGFQWIDIPTPQPKKWVSRVVASKWDVGTVYCSQSGYREDDWSAYLWKSTDYGKTWKSIVNNLPAETINVIREDPAHRDILYVGTDMGVYVSLDAGQTWEPLQGGLPHTPVHDLVVQARESDLVIGTHARSAWILPLKWVYELTPDIRNTPLTLFSVSNMTRGENWGYETSRARYDTSVPKSPAISGEIYTAAAGKGTIRLLDKDGKVVASSSFDASLGFNAVSLDLRLSPPKDIVPSKRDQVSAADVLKDPYESSRAQFVPVGDYTLEVQVGSAKASQKWKLEKP